MSKTVHLIIEGLDSSYQGSVQGLFSWPTWRTVRLRMRWAWCLWSSLIRDQRKKAFMYVDLLMSKSLTMHLVTEGVTSCSPWMECWSMAGLPPGILLRFSNGHRYPIYTWAERDNGEQSFFSKETTRCNWRSMYYKQQLDTSIPDLGEGLECIFCYFLVQRSMKPGRILRRINR